MGNYVRVCINISLFDYATKHERFMKNSIRSLLCAGAFVSCVNCFETVSTVF